MIGCQQEWHFKITDLNDPSNPEFCISRSKTFGCSNDYGVAFSRFGNRMNPNGIWAVVKRHAAGAGIKKNVSTHTFRHTCATHMMKNGAPVRHIQELLGHESLETTQLYTRVTINDLKAIHRKYHPGSRIDAN